MKSRMLLVTFAASLALLTRPCPAAEATTPPAGAKEELQELVGRVNDKLKAGSTNEQDLAGELKEFDALLARHQGEKTDEATKTASRVHLSPKIRRNRPVAPIDLLYVFLRTIRFA